MAFRSTRAPLLLAAALVATACASTETNAPAETPVLLTSDTELALVEGGDAGVIGVTLDQAPSTPVVVALSAGHPGLLVLPETLTFTSANFDTPQFVAIGTFEDVDLADITDTVTLAAPGLAPVTVAVHVEDDDSQALIFSDATLAMVEGTVDTFTVRLAAPPLADLTVLVNRAQQAIVVIPSTLVFTPANFDVPQRVIVATVHDDDVAPGVDTVYVAAVGDPHGGVPVAITDADTLRIVVDPLAAILDEGDSTTAMVSLSHRPLAGLTVTLTPADTVAVAAHPSQVAFTPANFATPVPVRIVAREDADQTGEITVVRLTAPGTDTAQVGVRINDNDLPAFVTDLDSLVVIEGDSARFHLSLAVPPAGDLVVTLQVLIGSLATVAPTTVTFTPQNYATPVTITVTGVQDAGNADGATFIRLEATGIPTRHLPLQVQDDD